MDRAWLVLKRENFAFPAQYGGFPAVPKHRTDEGFDKSGYASLYELEELRDVNEALRQLGVVPDGLVPEYANFGPSVNRQGVHSISEMADDYRLPHQYLPYRTKEEREGFKLPTFYVSDPDSGENTINRRSGFGPTIQDLIDARSRQT
tara:strand:+ start:350 stop:793 length:444 start_codon:yes stop_codon:yes gene_type:complete